MDGALTAARAHLAVARTYGVPWTAAWPAAVELGAALSSDEELPAYFDQMTATWPAWLAAYERQPSRLAELSPLSRPW